MPNDNNRCARFSVFLCLCSLLAGSAYLVYYGNRTLTVTGPAYIDSFAETDEFVLISTTTPFLKFGSVFGCVPPDQSGYPTCTEVAGSQALMLNLTRCLVPPDLCDFTTILMSNLTKERGYVVGDVEFPTSLLVATCEAGDMPCIKDFFGTGNTNVTVYYQKSYPGRYQYSAPDFDRGLALFMILIGSLLLVSLACVMLCLPWRTAGSIHPPNGSGNGNGPMSGSGDV
jgi:hypothetical protein